MGLTGWLIKVKQHYNSKIVHALKLNKLNIELWKCYWLDSLMEHGKNQK